MTRPVGSCGLGSVPTSLWMRFWENGRPTRALMFTTTVRPARPELTPATVSFYFYRKVDAAWTLQSRDDVVADVGGLARSMWRFSTIGEWYVRAQGNPTPYNANSMMSPPERYVVR